MLMAPPVLYFVSPRAAALLLVIDLVSVLWPPKPWPWFRGVFQLLYEPFDFHHNLKVEGSKPATLTKDQKETLTILAMHPHGIIPIQGFLWPALCDQYLNEM